MRSFSPALAIALIAGLSCGVAFDIRANLPALLTVSAAWTAAVLAYHANRPRPQLSALAIVIAASGWALGAAAVDEALHSPLRTLLDARLGGFSIESGEDAADTTPLLLEGRLRDDATPSESGATLRMDVERLWIGQAAERTAGGVSLTVTGAMQARALAEWTEGRRLRLPAMLRRPARYLNRGLADQERALALRGITLVGVVKSAALVELVQRGRWWEEASARVRSRTRAALDRRVRPHGDQSVAIATAILIGDRTSLDVEAERRLQEAGTYHVIAISGGNIAILSGLMLGVFACLGLRGRLATLAAIAGLAGYASIATGGPSVARATLMAVLYLSVRLIDHRTAAANAIGLTAAAVLLASPLSVTDVGFWLTFGATTAILVGATRRQDRTASWLGFARGVFLASCCAELALAPIGALTFQRVTIAGLALNFAALPAMTTVQVAAMAAVAFDLATLDAAANLSGRVAHAASAVLTGSAGLLDHAPWLSWRVPPPSRIVVAGYYGALSVAAIASAAATRVRASNRNAAPGPIAPLAVAATAACLVWIVAAPAARVRARGDGRLHLTMIDVGQGDAALVAFPNGRQLVVDTGGSSLSGDFDVGDRVIGPTLRARSVLDLDYLAVTHGDPDHIGGARSLVRDFAPRETWWGIEVAGHAPTAAVHREARRVRTAWRTLVRGDALEVGGVELRVHHPPLPDWERRRVRNDDSLVIELRYGRVSMLLTGDIGLDVEHELLDHLDLLPHVVLKVAHHGSATSTSPEFLARVRPEVAVIGVGRGNRYGHPVPAVLSRLRDAGAVVFRTDQEGEIEVTTDGEAVDVETFAGRRWALIEGRPAKAIAPQQ